MSEPRKMHPIQLMALLAMAAPFPAQRQAVKKPCLCGYGTFRDTHAANCHTRAEPPKPEAEPGGGEQ